jgi:hypothetical protein
MEREELRGALALTVSTEEHPQRRSNHQPNVVRSSPYRLTRYCQERIYSKNTLISSAIRFTLVKDS